MADLIQINNGLLSIGGNLIGIGSSGPSLPPYTMRLKYQDGVTPAFSKGTGVQVSSSPNIWDLTYENTDWSQLLYTHTNLLEVIAANSTGVTNMVYMFGYCYNLTSVALFDTSSATSMAYMFTGCSRLTSIPLFDTSSVTRMSSMFTDCTSLTSVPLFDTSSVTRMDNMFHSCYSLTSVPLFDTSSVTDMGYMLAYCYNLTSVPLFNTSSATGMYDMFLNCYKVESGALALYQQASTQPTVPTHYGAFKDCGRDTVTGAAELAQIPSDWK